MILLLCSFQQGQSSCLSFIETWPSWLNSPIWGWLKVKVKAAQSCPTLRDPMDYTVHGLLQARILEWVAFPFSSGSSRPRNRAGASCTADRFFTSELSGKPLVDYVHLSWQPPTCYSCRWPGCALFLVWCSCLGQLEPKTSIPRFCLGGEDEFV